MRLIRFALLSAAFAVCSMGAIAQAILPASWGFDTAVPTGWQESLGSGNTRYTNGFVNAACRLDVTGEFVVVNFVEEPGVVTYTMKGQNSGGSWLGTFTVEESADGNNWTAMRTFTDGTLPSTTFTTYNDTPQPTTRFIRWFYTAKVSGHNTALDEITVALPVAGTEQEINVSVNGNNVPSTTSVFIGNAPATAFTIENLGNASDLNITDITLSGANADQFSIDAFPAVVAPESAEVFTLNFNPIDLGTRSCTITIANDDASENPYIIEVTAISGDIASEPTAQSGALTFANVTSWDFNVAFTAGSSDAESFIVLRKKGGAITETPEDNQTYVRGQWIGGAQVVYVGQPTSFNARNIEASTTYHFAVFAFSGPVGFENYLTTDPTAASVTTLDPNIGNYYSGLNNNAPDFVNQLTGKLNPSNYFQIFYSNYISTLINEFYVMDTLTASGVSANAVMCQYSGDYQIYEAGFQFWTGSGSSIISREHSFPQSWMPGYLDAGFDDSEAVSDLHNLYPVNQVECNAVRSNYPYGEVVSPNDVYGPCLLGLNSFNQTVYEPRDEIKGDVARAMMYHAVKNNIPGTADFSFPEQINNITIPYGQQDYVIKQWHFQDLPDNYEIARNEYIQTKQNNRNGFIDSLEFPCYIRFSNLTKFAPQVVNTLGTLTCIDQGISYQWYVNGEEIEGATSATFVPTTSGAYTVEIQQFEQCPVFESAAADVVVSVKENAMSSWTVTSFPNPSRGNFRLSLDVPSAETVEVVMYNAAGARVSANKHSLVAGKNTIDMFNNLESGVYYVDIIATEGKLTQTIIVE